MGSGEIDQVDKICKLLGSPTVEQWAGLADMPDAKLVGKKLSSKNVRPASSMHLHMHAYQRVIIRQEHMLCGSV